VWGGVMFVEDLTMIIIAMIGAIAAVVIVCTICKTIITIEQHTNEIEKSIAEIFAKLDQNYNLKTTNLYVEKRNTENNKIAYANRKKTISEFFRVIFVTILDHLSHS